MVEPEIEPGGTGGLEEIQRRRRRYLLIGLGVMVLVCAGAGTLLMRNAQALGPWLAELVEGNWNEADVRSTIAKGEQIRAALEAYHADLGRYPDALTDLMPTYLPTLPTPDTGWKIWWYSATEGWAGYELGFSANETRYPSASTRNGQRLWWRVE